jgi:hypothetical protein
VPNLILNCTVRRILVVISFVFSSCDLQVAATVFFVGGLNYFHLQAIPTFDSFKIDSRATVLTTGRKILQVSVICRNLQSIRE